jgi:hypothetical protein
MPCKPRAHAMPQLVANLEFKIIPLGLYRRGFPFPQVALLAHPIFCLSLKQALQHVFEKEGA